jgi:hypothetical protein
MNRPRLLAGLTFLAACVPASAVAQSEPVTVVLLRTATDRGAYHFAELIHQRGRLVPVDFGYIDFDKPKEYREFFLGTGVVAINHPKLSLTTEAFLLKPFGEAANGALYLEPFFLGNFRPTASVEAEVCYFPYIPLNDAASAQHVLERAKLEYIFGRVKVGGGYGAYKFGDSDWQHKPFVTTTVNVGSMGSFEFWVQRVAESEMTVQIRYTKVFIH